MALMYAKYPDTGPIKKAVALVMSRQLPVRRLVPLFMPHPITSFFRMVHGHKRPSKGFSIGHVCDFISEFQVLVYYLDAWEGT
jgi:hypothetical protein